MNVAINPNGLLRMIRRSVELAVDNVKLVIANIASPEGPGRHRVSPSSGPGMGEGVPGEIIQGRVAAIVDAAVHEMCTTRVSDLLAWCNCDQRCLLPLSCRIAQSRSPGVWRAGNYQ